MEKTTPTAGSKQRQTSPAEQPAAQNSMQHVSQTNVLDDAETMQKQCRHLVLSDILGSYTGTDADGEAPDQDADDL